MSPCRDTIDAFVIDAVRTPMGRYRGALAGVRPDDLAAHVITAAVERTGIDPAEVSDVYLGAANQAGEDNRDVARMAALLAGLPVEVPGVTVNRLCASGLEAVNQASRALRLGEGDLYLAGGAESMSRAPWVVPKPERRAPPRARRRMHDTSLGWRLVNPRMAERYSTESMGETAENVAERYGDRPRATRTSFALRSHARAVAAGRRGPVRRRDRPGRGAVPGAAATAGHGRRRRGPARRHLAGEARRPAPRLPRGRHGDRRQRVDPQRRRRLPGPGDRRARRGAGRPAPWRGSSRSASPASTPPIMGIGPVPAIRRALDAAGMGIGDLDLIEINEAFAAQVLACAGELGIDEERLNVNGGAIALGHPLGCSGARLLTTLVWEMRRRGARHGVAALCVGVGQGVATIVENPEAS